MLLFAGCSSSAKYYHDVRTEIQPLGERADNLLTKSEVHTRNAWGWTAGGIGVACLGLSPLAPMSLALAAFGLFQLSAMEAGAAMALENEARSESSPATHERQSPVARR